MLKSWWEIDALLMVKCHPCVVCHLTGIVLNSGSRSVSFNTILKKCLIGVLHMFVQVSRGPPVDMSLDTHNPARTHTG